MERWDEVCKGMIPKGAYECELINGERNGLIVKLKSRDTAVTIDFGIVACLRMFDEGTLLVDWPPVCEAKKTNGFCNIIYEIHNGELLKSVIHLSGTLYEIGELHHYVVIAENYVIEVISKWEPDISVIRIW